MISTISPMKEQAWHRVGFRLLKVHDLVMLVGNPGVGKSTFAAEAARILTGQAPEVLHGTSETGMRHLFGCFSPTGGETRFLDGPLPRALKQERCLLVEEFDLIGPEVRAALLALRDQAAVVNPFTGERLVVPGCFRLIATSNPESMACRRDGGVANAMVDGFLVLEVPDLNKPAIRDLLRFHFGNVSAARRERVVELWEEYADIGEPESSRARLGYRAAAHLMTLLESGLDERIGIEIALINRYILDPDRHIAAKLHASLRASDDVSVA